MVTGLRESVVDRYSSQFTAEGETEYCNLQPPMPETRQDEENYLLCIIIDCYYCAL